MFVNCKCMLPVLLRINLYLFISGEAKKTTLKNFKFLKNDKSNLTQIYEETRKFVTICENFNRLDEKNKQLHCIKIWKTKTLCQKQVFPARRKSNHCARVSKEIAND